MQREKLTLRWAGRSAPVPDVMFDEYVADPLPTAMDVRALAVPPIHAVLGITPWTDPEPLDLCLELWKAWMAGDADRDLGAQTMRGLSGEGDGRGIDLHEAQQANDMRIAQATDAMIDSLSQIHKWAIYTMCSQATPWRFPKAVYADVATEASYELASRLKRNVCTAVLF